MPKLKAEFRKPKLTLYNTNYVALGVLTNRTHLSAHNIVLNEQVNETPSLTFDFPMGGMLDGDSLELLIKYKNEYFVIKEISMSDSDTAIMNVRAEHVACELKGIMVGYFEDLIGETPETMWSTVIENSSMTEVLNDKYIFETNITNTFRWLGSEEEKSVFEYLLTMAQQFDSCLLFSTDTYGKIHIELLHGDINRNKFIRKGKDLKQLNLTFNTESLFTKLTPFGGTDDDGIEVNIMNVNDGKSYITNYDYYLAKGMTQAEIDANPLCNQECVYRNEEVFGEDELLRLAQEELRRLSEPVVEGSISAIDLNVFEGGSYLSPILCEKVVVIDKDLKYSISCKITSIGLNFENPLESQIGISNVISYSSNLKDLIRNSEIVDRVITNGDNGRPNLNASKVKGIIDGHIAQLKYSMEDNITDVTDAVVLFENRIEGSSMYGALAIGSRGILISTQIDRVTNQWIWSTAIDAKGLSTQIVNAIEINGSQIRGDKISSYDEKNWINLDDGTFNFANRMFYDGQKFTIHLGDGTDLDEWKQQYEDDKALMDTELQDIKDSLGNLDDIIGDTFSDGIITEVERIRIEDSLIDLEKEKEDINNRYALVINDVGLTDGEEDALKSAYTSFNAKYTQLVQVINNVISDDKATESEKTNYQSKLREYNETIPPLTVAFDNALKKIAENKAKTLINETKSDIERDIQNVQQSVDGLEETMLNSFRDGIIDETEYKTIKESVHRLNTEKLDIDRNYEHLSVNIYIQSKTELLKEFKDAYDNYVEIHETLTSYVDETIGDRVATEEEITNINDMFNSHDEALAEYSVMQTKVMGEIADATASSNLDEYKEIVNKDITDVNTRINNLILDVGGAISDNILDQAELRIIENSITALETEKADVDKRYTEVMKDTVNLKGDARSTLSSSYSNFNTAHTNLINSINDMIDEDYAAELEKQAYQNAINSYNTALSTLSSAFDKALNEIAKNSAQAIMETIRQELQSDISDVQDNIDELEDYMGNAFRDGILSDAEKESIRTHLLTLATEKKDVDQQYTSLIGMTDLVGTAKTNLQDAYGNESKGYVQAYNSLINTINQILNKTTVNASDRTNLTNSFNNHDAKLANYSLRVNEAIESISEKKKQDLNNNITAKIETLENAISLRVTETRMEEIITDTQLQFNALQDMTNSLQNQVDGKIQTHYQSTDPSKNWTSTEKTAHEGDIWHDTLNNFTYRWNGSTWNKLTDADAEEAKTLANSKAQIFVYTPSTPYYVGDLWVQGGNYDGEIMRCINTRTSGSYVASDWVKASKYTDDTVANNVANNLVNNYYTKTQTDSAINVSNEGILSTVSTTYTTKDNMNNTLTNYAKKSDLSQTADSITATFTSSGGGNLVRNGVFENGTKFWYEHSYQLTGSDTTHSLSIRSDSYTGNEKVLQARIQSLTSGEYGFTQNIETVVGRQYVLTCYLAGLRASYNVIVRGIPSDANGWLQHRTYGAVEGGSDPKNWHQVVIPFVAQVTNTRINIVIINTIDGQTDGLLWVKRVMVCEGTVWTPFVPYSSEIYTGITKIDRDGITVTNGGLTIKNNSDETVLSADTNGNLGFFAKGTRITFNGNSTSDARKTELYCDSNNVFTMKVPFYNANNGFCVRADNNSGGWDIMKATAQNGQTYPLKLCGTSVVGIESSGNIVGYSNIYKVAGGVWYSAITSEPSSSQDSTQQIKYIRSQLGVSDPYIRITNENNSVYGAWIWVSDRRLKEDIIDINEPISEASTLSLDGDTLQQSNIGLDTIMKIHHYSFKYNEKSELKGSVKCGYISQQLQEVEPSFVCEIEQEDGESLLQPVTHTFIPYLSKAIQEQQGIIDNQQEQIKSLEEAVNAKDEEIRRLEERLSAIEKILKID